jgi:hypothetical protein
VLASPEPVTTRYERPLERVEFWSQRDSNPFFHFFESMWMLGGRNDIAPLTRFVARMVEFSDDGVTHHGAYGARWRKGMPFNIGIGGVGVVGWDQLTLIARALSSDTEDRRQVLQMWDSRSDLGHPGKDVPCNVTATFQVDSDNRVCMSVFNRSNDIVWGCYGANAVHFSYLLEYVAARAGLKVGSYHQISVNLHGYRNTFDPLADSILDTPYAAMSNPYDELQPYPLMQVDAETWDNDLKRFLSTNGRAPIGHFNDPFFREVAVPLLQAHDSYKDGIGEDRFGNALKTLEQCHAQDWRKAAQEWVVRRWSRWRRAADDGVFAAHQEAV